MYVQNGTIQSWLGYVELNNTVRSVPFWMCDLRSTQSLARIDIEVPGVTNGYVYGGLKAKPCVGHLLSMVGARPPPDCRMHGDGDSYGEADSQRDLLGWADQLGYTPGQRRLVITKNSGTVGYTGLRRTEPNGTWTTSGWCVLVPTCVHQSAPHGLSSWLLHGATGWSRLPAVLPARSTCKSSTCCASPRSTSCCATQSVPRLPSSACTCGRTASTAASMLRQVFSSLWTTHWGSATGPLGALFPLAQ